MHIPKNRVQNAGFKAILMCGGKGKRLNIGEKPMLKVCGKRLIEHVLDALWICSEVIAVSTKRNINTNKFLKNEGIDVILSPGHGYIQDFVYAIKILGISEPFILISSDLVFFKDVLPQIISYYIACNKKALTCIYSNGSYAGISLLDGYFTIFFESKIQDECLYKLSRKTVVNINTKEDLKFAEKLCH